MSIDSIKENRYIHPKIELCKKCFGTGKIYSYDSDDLLRTEAKEITCPICKGSGRIITRTKIEKEILPFSPELLETLKIIKR